MKNKNTGLILSIISFLLVTAILVSCTFENRKDGFSVLGETFKESNTISDFDLQLLWKGSISSEWSNTETSGKEIPLSSGIKWEPGHKEIRYFKVTNAGDIDFVFQLIIGIPTTEMTALEYAESKPLGDVIDVYLSNDINNVSNNQKLGTLNECFTQTQILGAELAAGNSTTFALSFEMQTGAGNEYQGYYDDDNNNLSSVGFIIETSAYAEDTEPDYDGFSFVLGDDDILYRIGNISTNSSNILTVSRLFEGPDEAKDELVSFVVTKIAGTAAVTYTANTSDWTSGTFKFTGLGVVNIVLKYNGNEKVNINLEIVNAINVYSVDQTEVTATTISASSRNVVLLSNMTIGANFSVSRGFTMYGNGFVINDNRTDTTIASPLCSLSGGILNNVHIKGREYEDYNMYNAEENWYSPCVTVNNSSSYPNSYIYNSHISGCGKAMNVYGNIYMFDSLVSGGSAANMYIAQGDVYMNNCITSVSLDGGKKGLSIFVGSENVHITLDGTFTQYNWVQKSEIPSEYSSNIGSIYSDSKWSSYIYDDKYLNLGIFCYNSNVTFDEAKVLSIITDNTNNNYGCIPKTVLGKTATCYTAKNSMVSDDTIYLTTYESPGQGPTLPCSDNAYRQYNDFNIGNTTSNPNYKSIEGLNSSFCVFDNKTMMIKLSRGTESQYEWNPMILPIKKYGSFLSYTVSMNGVDYTNRNIVFSQSGTYTVEYSYTDTNQYYINRGSLQKVSLSYTKSLRIFVVGKYSPDITFNGISSKTQVVGNDVYVMPDVSSTSSSITEKVITVGSTSYTIYCPAVTVKATNEKGTKEYSGTGYGAYFTPVFNVVNIVDYDNSLDTKTVQYTYNKSTTTWPHERAVSEGPKPEVFGYASDASHPYGAEGNSYFKFNSNSDGLCYSRIEIDSYSAPTYSKYVHWYYCANNGMTYNYYIQYTFEACEFGSPCFAPGTMITMADGSQKPIEEITFKDKIMTWNFYDGKYESKDICLLVDHGKGKRTVINLTFSDGTVLRAITEHGVYDYDINDFVYLSSSNCEEYVGHRFVKYKSNGSYETVTLTDAYVTTESINSYSIASADNLNAFASGMLTLTPPADYYNPIEKGTKLRYNTDKLNEEISKYGLYQYEDFADYLTPYQFYAFNVDYMKVPVSKGEITFEYILLLIEEYSRYFA